MIKDITEWWRQLDAAGVLAGITLDHASVFEEPPSFGYVCPPQFTLRVRFTDSTTVTWEGDASTMHDAMFSFEHIAKKRVLRDVAGMIRTIERKAEMNYREHKSMTNRIRQNLNRCGLKGDLVDPAMWNNGVRVAVYNYMEAIVSKAPLKMRTPRPEILLEVPDDSCRKRHQVSIPEDLDTIFCENKMKLEHPKERK